MAGLRVSNFFSIVFMYNCTVLLPLLAMVFLTIFNSSWTSLMTCSLRLNGMLGRIGSRSTALSMKPTARPRITPSAIQAAKLVSFLIYRDLTQLFLPSLPPRYHVTTDPPMRAEGKPMSVTVVPSRCREGGQETEQAAEDEVRASNPEPLTRPPPSQGIVSLE